MKIVVSAIKKKKKKQKVRGKGEAGKEGAPAGGWLVKIPETWNDKKPAKDRAPDRTTESAKALRLKQA